MIDDADLGAATWCFDHGRSAGRGSDTLPGARRLFLPLRTGRGVIGVIGLAAGRRADIILTPDERRLLDALMDQAAVAIERVRLAKDMDDARVAAEAERLRGALLTSLSHDLKASYRRGCRASFKRWVARSRQPTAWTGPAPCLL